MKMLCVIDSLGSGGAQRQLVTLACDLVSRGHHVEFFTYQGDDYFRSLLREAGIKVHHYQKRYRFSLAPVLRLMKLLGGNRYDVAIAFLKTPSVYLEIASLVSPATKVVVSERSMFPAGDIGIRERVLQNMHRLADAITVNSEHQRERMAKEHGWMAPKLLTIYNGVDTNRFSPSPVQRSPAERMRLLAISSVGPRKNPVNLAAAIKVCRDVYGVYVDVRWVGKKWVSDSGTRAFDETNEYLENAGISDQWSWLGEQADISVLLNQSDALIHPSFFEGLPNVICEALSCGKPVLAARIGDHEKLVGNGERGFLFDPFLPDDIAKSIVTLHRLSDAHLAKLKANARAFAERNLSTERCVEAYLRLFEQLVEV